MKKILAIAALLSCAAGAVYGSTTFTFPTTAGAYVMGSATGGTLIFKPSANVAMAYDASTATGVSYTVGSIHGQGSRVFGTSSVDTNIFYQDATCVGGIPTATATGATVVVNNAANAAITFPASVATLPTTYFLTGWTASK